MTTTDHSTKHRQTTTSDMPDLSALDACESPGLPPDPDGMNDQRAAWAGAALATFMVATGVDEEDALGDLLADLMHWADRHEFDFELALNRARGNYEAETIGETM